VVTGKIWQNMPFAVNLFIFNGVYYV